MLGEVGEIVSTDVAPTAEALGAPPQSATTDDRGYFKPPAAADAVAVVGPRPQDRSATPRVPRPPRRFHEWRRRYGLVVLLLDACLGLLAVVAAMEFFNSAGQFNDEKSLVLALGAALAWPLAVAVCHGYDQRNIGVGDDEFRAVIHAAVLAIAAAAVPSAVVDKYGVVALSVTAIPLAGAASLLVRLAGRRYLRRQQRLGRTVRRVVLVGSASTVTELGEVLDREQHGMHVLGVCVPDRERELAERAGLQVLGSLDDAAAVVRAIGADSVAVTGGEATRHLYLKRLAWALEGTEVELLVHPGLVEVAGPRMHIRPHVGLPLLHVEQPHFTGWRRFVKRGTDIALTLPFLVVFSPLLLAIAVAIKLDGGGPVFFRQVRVGLEGSTFTMWKFRSMHVDAEERLAELRRENPSMGFLFKMEDDPRVSRVGKFLRKFSLDELPQLFNVLGGSMSLVGPRPPLPSEVDGYENYTHRRLLVTPGLTGLWQVSGRSLLSWDESVRLDLRYVENWTLTLDLLIIWKTVFAVLARRGAY
ncbi:exopolysaccharide biosynthesis polyprenyl glycosylphosphotransferase [Microlunatus sagamiharensis]|uniref:Exopolysaccharide biosynthesis polyprenyl glycosylphosphotransferase n=1 Tax=Microlunatus sagamiharensis TaxID=546874 RepID=A0A1H2NG62_9ACTN|nr:exopolysaccharide biosynthesis polyprenyl glycosylphosphotransferase [Microlunatus sagamiharensis]